MTLAAMWGRLPVELRQRAQWCVAGPDKAPLAIGPSGPYNASVTDPKTWMSFEAAATYAHAHNLHIGYVISKDDPFGCIDLDVCDADSQRRKGQAHDPSKWTTEQQFNRYWAITQHVNSYTERSTYGKGLHIWVLGKIGVGCKRDGIEVYSQDRFIICTGDVVLTQPILDKQELLLQMVGDMRGESLASFAELVEVDEEEDDETVIERAINAGNADKFNDLCAGRWQQYGFPSQSEADLALMSIFTFYSKSNEQCRRLFRFSALGKREKAVKNDRYLNYTLLVIRGRQEREKQVTVSGEQIAQELIAQINAKAQRTQSIPLHIPSEHESRSMPAPASAAAAMCGPVAEPVMIAGDTGLPWPPGLAGWIAHFIYQSAPRPVKEVAIVAALGFLAGVCGKAWHIPQSGLNMYIILVARSAVGKEAMHSGVSAILKSASTRCPGVMSFVDFADFASGPALVKACAVNSSFVNVAGEWGRKLRRIAQDDGREGPMAGLRTVMTNLYQKSGPQSIVGGITYSNKDSNIASVSGVAFSMIGETTPTTFYQALTETMMEDGFLSRFTVIEYEGDRPPLNVAPVLEPTKALGDAIGDLCLYAHGLNGKHTSIIVDRSNDAAKIMWSFEQECDEQINSTLDESWRQMWNRASLKVMRIAALLAVADNWYHPKVEVIHVEWALLIVRKDITIMQKRIDSGDVGMGDHSRERKLMALMAEYLEKGASEGYKVPKAMQGNAIVPHKYLQIRCVRINSFSSHRLGANNALEAALRSMLNSGYLMEVDKGSMVQNYNFHGKCYRILSLPDYSDERKK